MLVGQKLYVIVEQFITVREAEPLMFRLFCSLLMMEELFVAMFPCGNGSDIQQVATKTTASYPAGAVGNSIKRARQLVVCIIRCQPTEVIMKFVMNYAVRALLHVIASAAILTFSSRVSPNRVNCLDHLRHPACKSEAENHRA